MKDEKENGFLNSNARLCYIRVHVNCNQFIDSTVFVFGNVTYLECIELQFWFCVIRILTQ